MDLQFQPDDDIPDPKFATKLDLRQARQEQVVDLRHDRADGVDGEDEVTQCSAFGESGSQPNDARR